MKDKLRAELSPHTAFHDWLRERKEEMAALLAELVAIPTENPPGNNYRACNDLLERRIAELGLECKRIVPAGAGSVGEDVPASLLASYGSGERTLYFHGHYDVVPAQSAEQFRPIRKENFLFGRGACDMKGGIVAMLYAMLAIRECGVELNGKIGLMLVPDEETGGQRGSGRLAREGLLGQGGVGMLLADRPAAWCGTRIAGRFHCACGCWENQRMSVCNIRERTRLSGCIAWSRGSKN